MLHVYLHYDFVGLPKYWLKDPSIRIFICLCCMNLKFEDWGGGLPSKRLGVVLVEVVSKHDCKSSDLVNSNRNVTITL